MEIKLSKFLQPKRRLTRQRSGFNVGGIKTGSECLLSQTKVFRINGSQITLSKKDPSVVFTKLFDKNLGIYGAGGYIKISTNSELTIKIELTDESGLIAESKKTYKVSNSHWVRVGNDLQIEVEDGAKTYSVSVSLKIVSATPNFQLEIYELYADVVKFYAEKSNYFNAFYEKTDLYKPDIYYLDSCEFDFDVKDPEQIEPGYIVSKSCNRCARFLPIDVENESNSLGFSNHCKKKAPCVHNAFSRYIY
ncbi:MAG: hypothetical protein QY322_02135 [bacterium]|nr:MAG: hypothetical protein QY322_02135 [bacterium]